jgi:hypothetical protein
MRTIKYAIALLSGLAFLSVDARAQTVVPSFFGQHVEFPTTPWPKFFVGSQRLWFGRCSGQTAHWDDIETARGVYAWTILDCLVSHANGLNTPIFYTFGIVPGWANGNQTGDVPPTNFQDLYDFVTTLVTREKGKIAYYEIWNEINESGAPTAGWWSGTMAQMLSIAQVVYPLIKSIDPSATVLCPSTVEFSGLAYQQAYYAAGGGAYCDALNYHAYALNYAPSGQAPEQVANIAAYYALLQSQYGLTAKPMMADEGSYGQSTAGIINTAALQKAYTSIYEVLLASAGVAQHDWFQYDSDNSWGVLWNGSTWLDAAGIAYRETQKWLIGATFTSAAARIAGTNQVRNTTGSGVVAGTPGTAPTDWSTYTPDSSHGISTQFVGSGIEGGVPYVDWRVFGTATTGATGDSALFFEAPSQIASVSGKQWQVGAYVKLVGGSNTGASVSLSFNENNSSGAFLAGDMQWFVNPVAFPLNTGLQSYAGKTANAGAAFVQPYIEVSYSVGIPVDITLRIGSPSMDNGSVWSASISKSGGYQAQIVWDSAGGPTSYSISGTYTSGRDLTGQPIAVGATVNLTNLPVIIENQRWKTLVF